MQTNSSQSVQPMANAQVLHEGFPSAAAVVLGGKEYPSLRGVVRFYETAQGVLVQASVQGLPYGEGPCDARIFGFHIHEGDRCTGPTSDPFADAGGHYNPGDCEHPEHAGDMPPLFGNNGSAWMAFLTNRFRIEDIVGRAVIIHNQPDDFTTQPAGNAGERIGCGIVGWVRS